MPLSLSAWESFYVIAGSAGAALTGLMFVVIALAAGRIRRDQADGVGAFSTPTVAHFANVLLIASIMTVPLHRAVSLTLCLAACAIIGLVSMTRAGVRMRRLSSYAADVEDWMWHVILPLSAYLLLLIAALLLGPARDAALVTVAIVVLALLFIGIRNAWDVAVYLVVVGPPRSETASPPESG